VKPLLSGTSPFVETLDETLRTADANLAAEEKVARTDRDYARQATVAEKWDALSLRQFYSLLTFGQFVRMLEVDKARVGVRWPPALQNVLNQSLADFDRRAAAVERELQYAVVPIKKLATVQLLTALYAMDYVQRH
jgi:hypothetical protein